MRQGGERGVCVCVCVCGGGGGGGGGGGNVMYPFLVAVWLIS